MQAMLLLAAAAVPLAGFALWKLLRRKLTPEERERIRRAMVYSDGRLVDGEVIDIEGDVLYYSYSVGGVSYSAAQDISAVREQVGEPSDALGPVTVKYATRNPVDSILVCEDWSGINSRGASLK